MEELGGPTAKLWNRELYKWGVWGETKTLSYLKPQKQMELDSEIDR